MFYHLEGREVQPGDTRQLLHAATSCKPFKVAGNGASCVAHSSRPMCKVCLGIVLQHCTLQDLVFCFMSLCQT
ncbi:hypothetical protein EMCRGX_G020908 [Ephydatia muelleri]